MADPLTSVALFGLQGVISGVSTKRQATATKRAARASKKTALKEAESVERAGTLEEIRFRRQAIADLDNIESMFAEAGIGPEDVAADVLLAAQQELELDALLIRQATQFGRESLESEAEQFGRQERDAKKAADKAFFGLF